MNDQGAGGDALRWTAHPIRRRPERGLVAAAVILAAAMLVRWVTGSLYWPAFAAAVLFLSLEGFFLPTAFEVGAAGVEVRKSFSKARIAWENCRRVYEDRHGLTLSPYRRKTVLEPYRAARLLYDGGDPVEIRRAVRRHLAAGSEWVGLRGEIEEIDGPDRTGQPPSEGRASG